MAVSIRIKRGTKANIESAKATLKQWEQVYATDTDEIGIYDGTNIRWQSSGDGIDLDTIGYMNYVADIFYRARQQSLFSNAWERSLLVDPSEISVNSTPSTTRGKAQYPNGATEGVIIPQGVESIGNSAFRNWGTNNKPLVIPNSVTEIGQYAFSDWSSNNQPLIIPDSVTDIKNGAFESWSSNNQPLVIPNSVTRIGVYAFAAWNSAKEFIMESETPPTITSDSFNNTNNAPFYVPDESVDDYKTATNWVDLADRIFPIGDKTGVNERIDVLETSKQDKLTAGDNITIDANNEISASGGEVDLSEIEQDILDLQNDKVNKVSGKGLSTNDFTNSDKNKLDGIEAGAEVNEVNSVNGKQGDVVLTQDDISHGSTYKRVSQGEKNTWNNKQDKLTAGDNITIDENNVISASGDGDVDLNEMSYFNYAGSIYGDKYSLLENAWESSLAVDPTEISVNSTSSSSRGKAQYSNGEVEGVIIPQSVISIGNYAFSDWSYNNQPLVIPNSVTTIGNYAFRNWTENNQPLVIPNRVTIIGAWAFSSWSSNDQPLVISDSVTTIGDYAFGAWTENNQPLTIPDSVTSIGNYAFAGWTSAKEFIMESETPPTITSTSFTNTNNAPFYVPDDSVDDYKTANNWLSLADRIFPISDRGNTYTKGEIDLMIGDIENALDAILGV